VLKYEMKKCGPLTHVSAPLGLPTHEKLAPPLSVLVFVLYGVPALTLETVLCTGGSGCHIGSARAICEVDNVPKVPNCYVADVLFQAQNAPKLAMTQTLLAAWCCLSFPGPLSQSENGHSS